MNSTAIARQGNLTRSILLSLVAIAALGGLMVFVNPGDSRKTDPETPPPQARDGRKRCEDELSRLFSQMQPGRMGITTDRVSTLSELNAWSATCGPPDGATPRANDQELLQERMQGEMLQRTLNERYLPEDVSHVRESLLSRDIVMQVAADEKGDESRVVSLFDFVVRTVVRVPESAETAVPETPYEAFLFGQGTAEDRAWAFASLLRQLRIDTVLIVPRGEAAGNWLIGVIEPREGIMLFDPRMGLPIPAPGDSAETALPLKAATLAQARDSDEVLRSLDAPESPYPLAAADLQDVEVRLIGTSSLWAPRMADLQFLLPPDVSVELYDGLGSNELRSSGLLERVVDAGANGFWDADDVTIWEFPENQLTEIEAARGAEETGLSELFRVFRGPYRPQTIPGTNEIRTVPLDKSLHFVRIELLKGEAREALNDFLPMRVDRHRIPANALAAEFAALWTGVCQYETGRFELAETTFRAFSEAPHRVAGHERAAWDWRVRSQLALGNLERARELLEQMPANLTTARDRYLLKRWNHNTGESTPENSAEEAATSATEPSATQSEREADSESSDDSETSGTEGETGGDEGNEASNSETSTTAEPETP